MTCDDNAGARSLDLAGLPLPLKLALILEKHGPTGRYALSVWSGTDTRLARPRLDAALACGWFFAHQGKWHLRDEAKLALRRRREGASRG